MANIRRQTSLTTDRVYDNQHRLLLADLRELVAEVKNYAADAEVLIVVASDTESVTLQVVDAPRMESYRGPAARD